jgi:hypothetical protein
MFYSNCEIGALSYGVSQKGTALIGGIIKEKAINK